MRRQLPPHLLLRVGSGHPGRRLPHVLAVPLSLVRTTSHHLAPSPPQLCESTAYEGMCYTLVGCKTSRGATTFVVVLTAAMLAVTLAVILVSAVSAARAKTMRLVSSKREPMRDGITLADGQQWHLFLSHVWSTGQVCHFLAPPLCVCGKGTSPAFPCV